MRIRRFTFERELISPRDFIMHEVSNIFSLYDW